MGNRILFIFPMPAYFNLMDRDLRGVLNPVPPIGLLYVAAALEQRGFEVRVWDQAYGTRRELAELLNTFSPALVGFGCCTIGYENALEIAAAIKRDDPKLPIVFGGPHVSAMMRETLLEPCVDYVVGGEAEYTMGDLAECLLRGKGRVEELRGIGYKRDGEPVVNPRAPLITDLDALPVPARHLVDLSNYPTPGVILSARGCPCHCIFCAAGPLSDRKYRARSTDNFIAEVVHLKEQHGITKFFIADDLFTANRRRAVEVSKALEALPFKVEWSCESRVDTVDPDVLEAMARAGCYSVQFGVESGNDQVLRDIKKFTSRAKTERAVKLAVEAGMKVACSIIIGHPTDTRDTIRDTIEFAAELRKLAKYEHQVRTDFSVATPLPGTDLYVQAELLGLKIHHTRWHKYNFITPVMDTPNLSAAEIRNLYYEAALSKMNEQAPWKEDRHVG